MDVEFSRYLQGDSDVDFQCQAILFVNLFIYNVYSDGHFNMKQHVVVLLHGKKPIQISYHSCVIYCKSTFSLDCGRNSWMVFLQCTLI